MKSWQSVLSRRARARSEPGPFAREKPAFRTDTRQLSARTHGRLSVAKCSGLCAEREQRKFEVSVEVGRRLARSVHVERRGFVAPPDVDRRRLARLVRRELQPFHLAAHGVV